MIRYLFCLTLLCASAMDTLGQATQALRALEGLDVKKEDWCTDYDRDDYPYPRSIEIAVVKHQGGLFSPYDMTCFDSRRDSDVEHIVAIAEAHRSGMCGRTKSEKSEFSSDVLNLTLASPYVNREVKKAKDATGWMPDSNKCWFAARIVAVKSKYGLTIDKKEARVLKRVLSACRSTQMQRPTCNR